MIDETSSLGLLKVGQNKWIQRLYNGEVSFSCAKSFIYQAQHSSNDEQGDTDEAIFARLKKGDRRIGEMQALLKQDLEIIDDDSYVKLRRKSSCFVPIFCIYTLLYSDFISQIKNVGDNVIRIDIPSKIYDGFIGNANCNNVFSNDFRIVGAFFQSKPFWNRLEETLVQQGYSFKRNAINYTEEGQEEFFIFPDDSRPELFYKRPKYKYQHELRIVLPCEKISFVDRINIQIPPLNDADRHLMPNPFYLTAHAKAQPK